MAKANYCVVLQVSLLLLLLLKAESNTLQPHALEAFNNSLIQIPNSCKYTVVISTSCSSPQYTRDQISLAFGDAYGNQIYAPRLDDPSSKAFERCSSDTYHLVGPCSGPTCYVYLYRTGPDGWVPGSVKIYGSSSSPRVFTFNTHIPSDTWFGFNLCGNPSSAILLRIRSYLLYLIVAAVATLILQN